ncbi:MULTISPECIES: hypothetical protein [Roseomonadaceae]|uniref:Uncharacterized protein n=1 Tax=Falsiroseomonas oleicola TaxID=2801474 RepID=A0ABS6H9H4_9PROT|nr:hypothetical protein [Roseomonas oleicola]MBU8544358.1 hypothetical protein [Roseomonas oleicola]
MSMDQGKASGRRDGSTARNWREMAGDWGRGSRRAPARHPRLATPAVACASWSPMDGDAQFQGVAGQDVLALRHVTLTQLISAINVLEPGLSLHLDQDGGIGFLDRKGEPAPFSGDMTIRAATLRFFAVSKLLVD